MFDALDLEYALLRAAARGSVGPYSLSESLHKLTFTQSLAFPALARGLASKQSIPTRRPQQHTESGLNAFAKVVTALVLVLVSVLVFGVVYKFVRTWGWLLVPDRQSAGSQEFDRPGTSDSFHDWFDGRSILVTVLRWNDSLKMFGGVCGSLTEFEALWGSDVGF